MIQAGFVKPSQRRLAEENRLSDFLKLKATIQDQAKVNIQAEWMRIVNTTCDQTAIGSNSAGISTYTMRAREIQRTSMQQKMKKSDSVDNLWKNSTVSECDGDT